MKRSQRPGAAAYFTDEQLDRAIAQAELRLRRFPGANMTRKMLEKMTTERWRRARAGRRHMMREVAVEL